MDNYRPISLTNTDYKILAYILTGHLEEHLPFLILPQQTAYIGTNICFIQDSIDHFCDSLKIILFLDYHKAFDSISHDFLFALLKHIGLPDAFLKWVRIMYSDVSSSVRHLNWFTPLIPIERGVHQGCPLSCHLFNLVSQVLIYYLQHHGFFSWWGHHTEPSSLYADDTAIISESIEQLPGLIQAICHVDSFTGLELNLSKTIDFSCQEMDECVIAGV